MCMLACCLDFVGRYFSLVVHESIEMLLSVHAPSVSVPHND